MGIHEGKPLVAADLSVGAFVGFRAEGWGRSLVPTGESFHHLVAASQQSFGNGQCELMSSKGPRVCPKIFLSEFGISISFCSLEL